mmetsp:Transcript_16456/g.52818  ORF Transcript_16456/g.52818 Transcript_16456/m.52818 type:complete len:99 (+) Transcript_16456:647-943(+)
MSTTLCWSPCDDDSRTWSYREAVLPAVWPCGLVDVEAVWQPGTVALEHGVIRLPVGTPAVSHCLAVRRRRWAHSGLHEVSSIPIAAFGVGVSSCLVTW